MGDVPVSKSVFSVSIFSRTPGWIRPLMISFLSVKYARWVDDWVGVGSLISPVIGDNNHLLYKKTNIIVILAAKNLVVCHAAGHFEQIVRKLRAKIRG
jgi:hypothetical protein